MTGAAIERLDPGAVDAVQNQTGLRYTAWASGSAVAPMRLPVCDSAPRAGRPDQNNKVCTCGDKSYKLPTRAREERMSSDYDIIIVGSGAGGGTMALALASTGKRILLLERGDYLRREQDELGPRRRVRRGTLPGT